MPTPPPLRPVRLGLASVASLALFAVGCSCSGIGSMVGGDADASGLPDLQKGIQTGLCEEVRGSRIPGADSHFFGELSISGDTVKGSERWQLHANSAWKDKGGKDCTIRWRMTGMKVPVTTCGDCDFGLQLSGAPELNASDCPEGLLKKEAKPMDPKYDVKLQPDGSVFVYFAKSGRLAAEGYHADGAMNYRTQHQCKWF
jgi:hypothetical protein